MAGAHCIDCGRAASIYAVQEAVYDDGICYCTSCGGLVKPDIVFFGEKLPARFHRRRACDMTQADLLIVMGTSLVVQPFAGMLDDVPPTAPRLLINRERVGEGAVAAAAADCRRQTGCNAPDSSSSSDEDCTGSSCDADDGDDTGSGSGTDIEGLISDVDSNDADVGASKGFDFLASSGRDALCLGDCDSSVRRLASMLGWGQELEELVAEAAAAAAEDEAEC
eukprot:jgi/Chrzof1/14716/Cz09g13070.t1